MLTIGNGMLSKIQDKPVWYKLWALSVAIAALYVLFSLFYKEELSKTDYLLMVYTHASILLDLYLFPKSTDAHSGAEKSSP